MQIPHPDAQFTHIVRQIFRHALRKGSNQDLVLLRDFLIDLAHQIINLSFYRAHLDLRIQKAGRSDHLLCTKQFMLLFVLSRRRRYEHYLIDLTLKLIKAERTVVHRRRQTESIFHKRPFSRLVAMIHTTDLRYCLMRLINHHNKIIREIVNQCVRRLSRFQPGQMSGIILDSRTEACLPHHLYIKIRTLRYSLCFQKLSFTLKVSNLLFQLFFDRPDSRFHPFFGNYIMGCRKDCHMTDLINNLSRQNIYLCNSFHFVPKKLYSKCNFFRICREYLQHITMYPECSPLKIHLVTVILDIDKLTDDIIPVLLHTRSQRNYHLLIVDRRTQTIDTGYTGDDNNITALR